MFYPRMVGELLFGSSTEFKEVCAKPDLLYMSLVAALRNNLFNSKLFFTFLMLAQPD